MSRALARSLSERDFFAGQVGIFQGQGTADEVEKYPLKVEVQLPNGANPRIELESDRPWPLWSRSSISKMIEFLALEPNWDSYGAHPVELAAINHAITLLFSVVDEDTPAPAVVPTPAGGVQFEWHTRGHDIEVAVDSQGAVQFVIDEDQDGGPLLHVEPRIVEAVKVISAR